MVDGHVSDLSATILFPFLKKGKILGIKVGVLGEKRATSQGMWVLGSGIEIPVIIHIYMELKFTYVMSEKMMHDADAKQVLEIRYFKSKIIDCTLWCCNGCHDMDLSTGRGASLWTT